MRAPAAQFRAVWAAKVVVAGRIAGGMVAPGATATVVNSGSVSLSRDGGVRATYVVVEDGRVQHRRVAYEVERVAAELAAMDHPDAETYAARLRTGTWTPPSPPPR